MTTHPRSLDELVASSVLSVVPSRYGTQGQRWLEELPDTVARACDTLGVTVNERLAGGALSCVLHVSAADGRPAVLKLHPTKRTWAAEAATLTAWRHTAAHLTAPTTAAHPTAGGVCPEVLGYDASTNAVLMEKLAPAVQLRHTRAPNAPGHHARAASPDSAETHCEARCEAGTEYGGESSAARARRIAEADRDRLLPLVRVLHNTPAPNVEAPAATEISSSSDTGTENAATPRPEQPFAEYFTITDATAHIERLVDRAARSDAVRARLSIADLDNAAARAAATLDDATCVWTHGDLIPNNVLSTPSGWALIDPIPVAAPLAADLALLACTRHCASTDTDSATVELIRATSAVYADLAAASAPSGDVDEAAGQSRSADQINAWLPLIAADRLRVGLAYNWWHPATWDALATLARTH